MNLRHPTRSRWSKPRSPINYIFTVRVHPIYFTPPPWRIVRSCDVSAENVHHRHCNGPWIWTTYRDPTSDLPPFMVYFSPVSENEAPRGSLDATRASPASERYVNCRTDGENVIIHRCQCALFPQCVWRCYFKSGWRKRMLQFRRNSNATPLHSD